MVRPHHLTVPEDLVLSPHPNDTLDPFLGSFPSTQATGPSNKDPAGAEQPYLLCLAEEPGRGHEVFSQQALWMVTC